MASSTYRPVSVLWNANGILNHTRELHTLLKNRYIDIALLTENHHKDGLTFFIQGYSFYRTDHRNEHMEVMVSSSNPPYPFPSFLITNSLLVWKPFWLPSTLLSHHLLSRVLSSEQNSPYSYIPNVDPISMSTIYVWWWLQFETFPIWLQSPKYLR